MASFNAYPATQIQLPNFAQALAQAQQVKGAQQQQRLREMQMDAYQRDADRKQRTSELRARDIKAGGSSDELMAHDPEAAGALDEGLQKRQAFKAYSFARAVERATTPEEVAEIAMRAGRTPEQAQRAAANFAADPDAYRNDAAMGALSIKDRFGQRNADRTYQAGRDDAAATEGHRAATLAETRRHNRVSEANEAPGIGFAGKGMRQQAANVLMAFAAKERSGAAPTPEEADQYAIAHAYLSQPQRYTTPDGRLIEEAPLDLSRFPTPQRAAQAAPAGGGTQVGQRRPLPPEAAAKAAGVIHGIEKIREVRTEMFDENGGINRAVVAAIASGVADGGRRAQIRDALEAQLRIESGAAVPPEEVDRAMDRFVPGVFDGAGTAKRKLKQLEERFKTTLDLMGRQDQIPADTSADVMLDGKPHYKGADGKWYMREAN